jgi:hypothetical protein
MVWLIPTLLTENVAFSIGFKRSPACIVERFVDFPVIRFGRPLTVEGASVRRDDVGVLAKIAAGDWRTPLATALL